MIINFPDSLMARFFNLARHPTLSLSLSNLKLFGVSESAIENFQTCVDKVVLVMNEPSLTKTGGL